MVSHSFTSVAAVATLLVLGSSEVHAWSMRPPPQTPQKSSVESKLAPAFASMAAAAIIFSASPVLADEYGVEKEAPTLFTGETVQVRFYVLVFVFFDESTIKKSFFHLISLSLPIDLLPILLYCNLYYTARYVSNAVPWEPVPKQSCGHLKTTMTKRTNTLRILPIPSNEKMRICAVLHKQKREIYWWKN